MEELPYIDFSPWRIAVNGVAPLANLFSNRELALDGARGVEAGGVKVTVIFNDTETLKGNAPRRALDDR